MRGDQIRRGRLSRARAAMTVGSAAAMAAGLFVASPAVVSARNTGTLPSSVGTTVFDAATTATWSGAETTGASAYDTSTVGGVIPLSPTPTGTVTYTLWTNSSDCTTGTSSAAGTETLDATGNVPNSNPTPALAAGSYAFQAVYSGDTNYAVATSPCEAFTVGMARAPRRPPSSTQPKARLGQLQKQPAPRRTTRRRSVAS
jgi:hypothetical protein